MTLGAGEPPAGPWRVEPVAELVRLLMAAARAPRTRPRLVAVDGRSASGKTTVCRLLHAATPRCAVVHTDDVAWYESFFGWSDLIADGILRPLRAGRAVRYRPPAWEERARDGAIEIPAGLDLVLVEGVGAARRTLMPLLDAVVWVQSDTVEAERRGIERDGGDQATVDFWQEWEAEEIPFLAADRPWDRADVIVCGTPTVPHDPDTEVVLAPPEFSH